MLNIRPATKNDAPLLRNLIHELADFERLAHETIITEEDIVRHGFGAMPSYASRVEPDDRWRIAAYIRVLQLSENATINDVPADQRAALENAR